MLIPVECSSCESLYCKACIIRDDMDCPKRCGGKSYTLVNRIVLGQINRLKFKCEKYEKCNIVTTYADYEKHI